MNRTQLKQLAEDRIQDAEHLLNGGRWAGAYYLAGYAVECGLKACILAFVQASGAAIIFEDRKYSEKCWTHDLEDLIKQANLKATWEADVAANTVLRDHWNVAINWNELSRYEQKTQKDARDLYDSITNHPDGVLAWIRIRW